MTKKSRAYMVLLAGVLSICAIAHGQIVQMDMASVPYHPADTKTQQPLGPEYSFSMGRYEVTVAQYVAFLNDAQANQGNERA